LLGSGMNGKSAFLRLLTKFIGRENLTATELDTLLSSRFEVTRLHRKLCCIMGETNFTEMSKTSIIKKLTGQDLIGFEYKNKDPIDDYNYAKIFIATNSLPSTTDKTVGFYRRWLIIDFPNQFSEKKDILADIPDEEYEALAVKSLGILKDLLTEKKFYNEGSIEERAERYETKSNFLEQFIKLYVEESSNENITSVDFAKKFGSWCKENRHREMADNSLGMAMKKLGYETRRIYFNWLFDGKGGTIRCWTGIKWKI
jgi:putative DNA primase/helicase